MATPPIRDFYLTPRRCTGLGAAIAVRLLAKAGHELSFFNFPILRHKPAPLPLPPDLDHLEPLIAPTETGPLAFFTRYRHFGPTFAECARRIVATRPDLLLLSSFAFAYADQALELARAVEALAPRLTILVGGAGPTAHPAYYLGANRLKIDAIDLAFVGEAESGLVEFADRFSRGDDIAGLPGICCGDADRCALPPSRTDADDLEFVWSASLATRAATHLSTSLSRGCPRQCQFCSNFLAHGRRFRTVPFDRVAAGLGELPADRPLTLNFEDDNLLLARDYWLAILRLCRDRFPDISFRAENGLDYGLLDEETVGALADLGMERFDLSLASADPRVLAAEQRHADLERLERLLRRIDRCGLPATTYFICGLREDTPASVIATLRYLAELPTQIGISPFYPVPGLPGFTEPERFCAVSSARCTGSAAYSWTGSLSSSQLVTAFRLARYLNLDKKNPRTPEEQDLLDRCRRSRRLYTWSGRERTCIPAPGLDAEMVDAFFSVEG